jgi:hypothetical protein
MDELFNFGTEQVNLGCLSIGDEETQRWEGMVSFPMGDPIGFRRGCGDCESD